MPVIPIVIIFQMIDKEGGEFGNKRTNGNQSNYNIIKMTRIVTIVLETWVDLLSLWLEKENHQLILV